MPGKASAAKYAAQKAGSLGSLIFAPLFDAIDEFNGDFWIATNQGAGAPCCLKISRRRP
jgi:hypothetical protein